jgi:serine/threonine-protein kinase
LEAGRRLGHFTIIGSLGRGGMGEVWRARDSVLGREVALKTLPREFVQDAERLARFEREARLLATVSHPNIGAIYGLEQHDEERFLVLELIEGETLAERLYRGALRVTDALKLALQLAEALEAAHEKGVIHRDLKPSNIKITPDGRLHVLDFGLAKALSRDGPSPHTLTIHSDATAHGAILGTPAYMAPEQARGEPAGVRADVWAFGCVLYEMLTGKGTFDGRTGPEMLANVLRAEPDWQPLPLNMHPRVRDLLERCLEKEPRNRYAGISDARVDIEKVLVDPTGALVAPGTRAARPASLRWAAATIAVAVVAAVAVGVSLWSSSDATDAPVVRFDEPLRVEPNQAVLDVPLIDISRDGTRVAYATGGGIFVRDLDDPEAHALQSVTGFPTMPRFSPNGEWLAYMQGPGPYALKIVPLTGGAPQTVVRELAAPALGLDWTESGTLVFVQPEGIVQVPIEGGELKVIVRAGEGEAFGGARLLPDGDAVLFTVTSAHGAGRWDAGQVVMQSLATGERRVVWRGGSDARYVTSGHLVYAQGSELRAVPFDAGTGEVSGSYFTVIEGVTRALSEGAFSDTAQYAVSDGGTLVYLDVPGASARVPQRGLAWVNRDGTPEPISVQPDDYTFARVSPDGEHFALVVGDGFGARGSNIWIFDVRTATLRQLTFTQLDDAPVWSLDSKRLYFRRSATSIHVVDAGGGTPELVTESSTGFVLPSDLSRDGQTMLLVEVPRADSPRPNGTGIATLTLGDRALRMLFDDPRAQNLPSFAPNGAWIAYQEDSPEGGVRLNIRPFPEVQRARTPIGAGMHPVFSQDGTELFYFDGGGLSVASVEYGASLRVGSSRPLFRGSYWYGVGGIDGARGRAWDPSPDGERFLMITMPSESEAAARLHVVVNWSQELRQRAPTR